MAMNLWNALLIVGISAAPVIELRGGIPVAIGLGFSPTWAFGLALLGNIAVVPFLLWGFRWAEQILMRWRFARKIMEWVFTRSRRKGNTSPTCPTKSPEAGHSGDSDGIHAA